MQHSIFSNIQHGNCCLKINEFHPSHFFTSLLKYSYWCVNICFLNFCLQTQLKVIWLHRNLNSCPFYWSRTNHHIVVKNTFIWKPPKTSRLFRWIDVTTVLWCKVYQWFFLISLLLCFFLACFPCFLVLTGLLCFINFNQALQELIK